METQHMKNYFAPASIGQIGNAIRTNADPAIEHSSEEPMTKNSRYSEPIASSSNRTPNIRKKTSFKDLPPEMVEEVLSNAFTLDLLHCRLVNRQWNEISSRIIQERDDISLCFEYSLGRYVQRFQQRQCKPCSLNIRRSVPALSVKHLTDLVICLNESPLFPFTSYRFDQLTTDLLVSMIDFIRNWGNRVRSLRVSFSDSRGNVEILLKMLCGRLPNLKKLTFGPSSPIPTTISLSFDSHQLRLPKLEVLCIPNDNFRIYGTMVEDILTASSNLKTFLMIEQAVSPNDMEILYKSEKLHCLKDLKIVVTEELIAYWKESPDRFELQLRSLSLSFNDIIYLDHELNSSASEIVNRLFHSSRNTLQTLVTQPLGPLIGLVFPKFDRLRQLRLRQELTQKDYQIFPFSFDWPHKLPNINELDVDILSDEHNLMFDESLKCLPNIEILRVSWKRNRHVFAELIKRTPNVKTLAIRDDYSFWFRRVRHINFEEISTYLPKLENLSWQIHIKNSFWYKLDAVITGLPANFCKSLAEEFRNENDLSADKVSKYWKRCNPSIHDLTELKTLHIHFDKCTYYIKDEDDDSDDGNRDEAGFDPDSIFYETGFTKVSQFLGFDQMPNLEIEIHHRRFNKCTSLDTNL
ncbi:uncharacterized protein LOC119079042 [Bradysia coprophila]|uniref:uncharacterized protein LOC119079042 n=1 Tax=Bradysia coprophila TaxID=38358 RepID=UPI00187DCD63|nr:uncharacterized protein LOC119079042 [Bradysia coprophila]